MSEKNSTFEELSEEELLILERLKKCLPGHARFLETNATISKLGFDSFDLVELLCFVEEEFGIQIEDEKFAATKDIADIVKLISLKVKK